MNQQEFETIIYLLKDCPLSAVQAVRIVLEGMESWGEAIPRHALMPTLRRCMQLGVRALKEESRSVNFREAVAHALELRRDRSPRTIQDFRQCMNALMRAEPRLADTQLTSLSADFCRRLLQESFPTAPRRRKAHACLRALFNHAMRMGWCHGNPIRMVEAPRVRETPITPLSLDEVRRLLHTARQPGHAPCQAALGIMLYAGVRPHELTRLSWEDVDLDEGEIGVPARHSKTGGGRHIPICPALHRLLEPQVAADAGRPICPPNWQNRWRELRRAAGFTHWQQDVLRHTFASYFAKAYRDLPTLQLYMGHRDVALLRSRYVNLKGLRHEDALHFWQLGCGKPGNCSRWAQRHDRRP